MNDSLSESLALDFAYNGITSLDQLKEEDKQKFALEIFEEETDLGDQITMLIDSNHFNKMPALLSKVCRHRGLREINGYQNEMTACMLNGLVETYSPKMESLLQDAVNSIASNDRSNHLHYTERDYQVAMEGAL